MNIRVAFAGDHPTTINGIALAGYHRPLNGEVANLTITAERSQFFPEWLESPPLGMACSVYYGEDPVMEGYLYGVRASAAAVELTVEG